MRMWRLIVVCGIQIVNTLTNSKDRVDGDLKFNVWKGSRGDAFGLSFKRYVLLKKLRSLAISSNRVKPRTPKLQKWSPWLSEWHRGPDKYSATAKVESLA